MRVASQLMMERNPKIQDLVRDRVADLIQDLPGINIRFFHFPWKVFPGKKPPSGRLSALLLKERGWFENG
jgi:hypothetical protein